VLRFLATAAALWLAARLVPGISHTGSALALFGVAAVFGVINSIVAPVVKLLSLPVILLTLGLFALVINALMLGLTSWVAGGLGLGFHVSGFVPAFLGSLVISFASALIMVAFDGKHPRLQDELRR
jgi:putative membrane protein